MSRVKEFVSMFEILHIYGILNTVNVMNIKWDHGYYQPWSDNEWLVNKMMALLDEDITVQ